MARAATSRDVARLAGVAQSTVSNVLNDRQPIAPATRERVLAAMAELNYRPNLAARAMRTRRTGRLAVVLPGVTAVPTLGTWALMGLSTLLAMCGLARVRRRQRV